MHKQSIKEVEMSLKVMFKDIVPSVDVKHKNLLDVDASTCAQPQNTFRVCLLQCCLFFVCYSPFSPQENSRSPASPRETTETTNKQEIGTLASSWSS